MDFFDEPCSFEIKREIATVVWPDQSRMAFPLHVFRIQAERANRALAEYDARKAEVVPMRQRKKRGGDHAA